MLWGDFLNWDFIMPHYTDEQWAEIKKELEEMQRQSQPKQTGELSKHDDYIKAIKDYKKNMSKVRNMDLDSRNGFKNPWVNKREKKMLQSYKTLDKTEHKGGFTCGYIREEFLNHCTYKRESGNIIFTPIQNKPYKFSAYDWNAGYRLTFDKLNYVSFNELKFLEFDIIELTFYYTCNEKEKQTTITIDNDMLLDFTFSTMY